METVVAPGERAVLLSEEAERHWRSAGRPPLLVHVPDPAPLQDWLLGELARERRKDFCRTWAATRLGVGPQALRAVSPALRASFAERLAEATPGEPEAAALCAEVLDWAAGEGGDTLRRLERLALLDPDPDWRPRCLLWAEPDLLAALALGDRLARMGLAVALRVELSAWQQWLATASWDKISTRWREAAVHGASPLAPSHAESETERYVRETAPVAAPLVRSAMETIARAHELVAHAEGEARSAAEALLFAVLEARPFTRGRFRLNAPLDFPFGGRAAEGDLVAATARLVVEIDGFSHFQGAEAWRRDRRKDAALQEHGWFVLRFLTDDVVSRLEEIVAAIEAQLARRDLTPPSATDHRHSHAKSHPA